MGETDDFEWDDTKEARNIQKHGMSLRVAAELFASDFWLEFVAGESRSDASRSIAIGLAFGRLLICVYTWRGQKRRVISLRLASRRDAVPTKKQLDEAAEAMKRIDWAKIDGMTDEEIEAAARSDPDNPPLSDEELAQLRRVRPRLVKKPSAAE